MKSRKTAEWAAAYAARMQENEIKAVRQKAESDTKPKVVPDRKVLRAAKINVSRSKSQYGRLIRAKMAPSSLSTLIAIHARDENGRTVRKFVIPRDKWAGVQ